MKALRRVSNLVMKGDKAAPTYTEKQRDYRAGRNFWYIETSNVSSTRKRAKAAKGSRVVNGRMFVMPNGTPEAE